MAESLDAFVKRFNVALDADLDAITARWRGPYIEALQQQPEAKGKGEFLKSAFHLCLMERAVVRALAEARSMVQVQAVAEQMITTMLAHVSTAGEDERAIQVFAENLRTRMQSLRAAQAVDDLMRKVARNV